MFKAKPALKKAAEKVRDLYQTTHRYNQVNTSLTVWWGMLQEAMSKDSCYEEIMYVVRTVNRDSSLRIRNLLRKAIDFCDSIEQITEVYPRLPTSSWSRHKKLLIRKAYELARNKEEFFQFLDKCHII